MSILGHRELFQTSYFVLNHMNQVRCIPERQLDDQDPEVKLYRFPPTAASSKKQLLFLGQVLHRKDGLLQIYRAARHPKDTDADGFAITMEKFQSGIAVQPRIELRQPVVIRYNTTTHVYEITGLHEDLLKLLDPTAIVYLNDATML